MALEFQELAARLDYRMGGDVTIVERMGFMPKPTPRNLEEVAMSSKRNQDAKTETATTTHAGTIELDETQLEDVAGGSDGAASVASWKVSKHGESTFPSKWKVSSFDGKGNDVMTEEIVLVVENVERRP